MAELIPIQKQSSGPHLIPIEEESSFWENIKGVGAAATDIGMGLFKFPVSVGLAALGTGLSGLDPNIARQEAGETLERAFPSIGPQLGVEETTGYKVPMWPFEQFAKGTEAAGRLASDDPYIQGLVKQGIDISTFALPGMTKSGVSKALMPKARKIPRVKTEPVYTKMDMGEYIASIDPVRGKVVSVKNKITGEVTYTEPKVTTGEIEIRGGLKEPTVKTEPTLIPIDEPIIRSEAELRGRVEPPMEAPEVTAMRQVEEGLYKKEHVVDPLAQKPFFEKVKPWEGDRQELPFETMKRHTARIEKQGAAGPQLGRPKKIVTDDVLQDITKNPQLLQDYIPQTGIDFWKSALEDLNLSTEKANRNKTLKYRLKQTEEQRSYVEQLLARRRPVEEVKKEIENYFELENKVAETVARIYEEPLTRKLYPENIHPFGKKQGGALRLKDIAEGLKELANRASRAWEAAKLPFGVRDEGGIETLGRMYGEFKTSSEEAKSTPQVFRTKEGEPLVANKEWFSEQNRINKGPGGKQSGAVDPKAYIDELRKASKSVEEFTKKLVDELGEELRPIAASLYKKEETKTGEYISAREVIKSSNVPKKMEQYMLADARTSDQFVKEESAKGFDTWKEINLLAEMTEVLPLSIIAARAKKSPVINWIWNKITTLDNELYIKKEMAKYGTEFIPDWRGFKTHKRSDDGAMTILESLPKNRQKIVMDTFFEKFEGKNLFNEKGEVIPVTKEVLKMEGLSDKEARGILATRAWMDKFVKDYNSWAKEIGEPEITPRPNYLPHVWDGDYRVFVYRIEGGEKTLIRAKAAKTFIEARTVAKELAIIFPEFVVESPVLAKSKYKTSDIQAYKDAIEFLEKDDPVRAILDKTFNKILEKRGFRKTTLFRKGVEGFDTDINIVGDYLDKGYNFLYNQKKKAGLVEITTKLKEAGLDLSKDYPNTYKYLLDVIAQSTHSTKDMLPLLTAVIESVWIAAGRGPRGAVKDIKTLNGWATANYLTTPVFLGVQGLQPAFNAPKAVQLGKNPIEITRAYGDAYNASVNPMAHHIEAINWAVENGYIQSRIANLVDLRTDNPRTWLGRAPVWWMNKIIGRADSQLARVPSFLFYDSLLKKDIPNKLERWHQAGMLANEMMINYAPSNVPLIFGRLGAPLSAAVRPFTQFPLGYFGQLLTYMGDIKAKHTVAPLAAFLAIQATLGGVTGFIGVPDANKIIDAINKMFGYTTPTLEETIAKSEVSNTIIFGPTSTITGLNISGTVSAPSMLNPPSMPGVGYGWDVASQGFNVINKSLKGELREADKMLAAQKILPKIAQGAIEEYFTKPGKGTPNPYNNIAPDLPAGKPGALGGLVQTEDWSKISDKAARYMGSRTPEAARARLQVAASKKQDKKFSEKRGQYIKLMVDRLAEKKEINTFLPKYMKYDGDPKKLTIELLQGLMDRNKTYAQRYLGTIEGLSGAQRAQRLKDFNLLIDKQSLEEQIKTLQELNDVK